jgi:hypothetical protein
MGCEDIKLDLQKKTLTLLQEPQPLDKYTSYLSCTSPLLPSFHPSFLHPLRSSANALNYLVMTRFQEWLMDQPLSPEIAKIPEEYWPLIAMIGHE